ncbi:Rv2175c family DNA-binding protein [Arcanobacterium bovis]|uniref:DNA-binding protein n=1 Tax=Arcanobacterium bovis TaxID=2529275 RepID=A0A4Q9V165_9ACTO|nr:Rv2175c family DNA-binding protein [Arcanobacterium bovis]TBW22840.1 DNA-binding protein [Arcanobacterium bovis]
MNSIQEPQWLSIPEVADLLSLRQRDVRSLLAEKKLVAVRRGSNKALSIHPDQIVVNEGVAQPLKSLRGTLIALSDAGFSDDEAMDWLLRDEPELGKTPLECLRTGNVHAVRRVITGLIF